jgi:hypothetical protein
MKRKDQIKLGDIYGTMLEGVETVKHEGKYKKTDNAFTKQNKLKDGGPEKADGYNKALNDEDCDSYDENDENEEDDYGVTGKGISELKDKIKKEQDPEKKKRLQAQLKELEKAAMASEGEETLKESRKITKKRLNNFMAKKSTFDKLFESVMSENWMGDNQEENQDVDALGLGKAPTDDEMDDEMGDEDEGSVTFTLDRATAEKLLDVIGAAMEPEGDDLDFGDEDDDLDFDDEDDDYDFQEDEERGVHPTDKVGNDGTVGAKDSKGGGQQHKFQQKNNKVSGRPQPKNQGTKVVGATDKVGNDGDYGHALHGAKQPNMGKQNKVSDIRQTEDFFR